MAAALTMPTHQLMPPLLVFLTIAGNRSGGIAAVKAPLMRLQGPLRIVGSAADSLARSPFSPSTGSWPPWNPATSNLPWRVGVSRRVSRLRVRDRPPPLRQIRPFSRGPKGIPGARPLRIRQPIHGPRGAEYHPQVFDLRRSHVWLYPNGITSNKGWPSATVVESILGYNALSIQPQRGCIQNIDDWRNTFGVENAFWPVFPGQLVPHDPGPWAESRWDTNATVLKLMGDAQLRGGNRTRAAPVRQDSSPRPLARLRLFAP